MIIAYFSWQGLGGPPRPVIVTIRDNKDYFKVLWFSYHSTITGWGVLLRQGSLDLVTAGGESRV